MGEHMQMNHYLWSLYLQAGGQTIVERFTAFETGDREKFAAIQLFLLHMFASSQAEVQHGISIPLLLQLLDGKPLDRKSVV